MSGTLLTDDEIAAVLAMGLGNGGTVRSGVRTILVEPDEHQALGVTSDFEGRRDPVSRRRLCARRGLTPP